MRFSPRRPVRRWAGAFVLAASFVIVGCGGSAGTITGKVYLGDVPLKGGTVTFLTADKQISQIAKIGEDGRYTIDKMPLGPVNIAVETKSLQKAAFVPRNAPPPGQKAPGGRAASDPKALAKRYMPIHDKYADPATSGLDYIVKGGKQEHDIRLK